MNTNGTTEIHWTEIKTLMDATLAFVDSVFVLFRAQLDADGYVHWKFVAVSADLNSLHAIVAEEIIKHPGRIVSLHPGVMTAANNYTIVSTTNTENFSTKHIFGDCVGFIIQPEKLLRS